MHDSWMIDELDYAGAEHLDEGFVAGFDEKQGRPDPGPDIEAMCELGLGPESRVADFGAGTGQFALPAARRFAEVVAVDPSSAMLALLSHRAAEEGLANLRCIRAGFLGYEHTGRPFDGVHTRHALHQLPDFWKALALDRLAACMRPGAALVVRDLVYDFEPGEATRVFEAWFSGAATDPARGYTRDDYAEHIRTEHSTFRWLFEVMLDRAGFDVVTSHFHAGVYASYLCRRR